MGVSRYPRAMKSRGALYAGVFVTAFLINPMLLSGCRRGFDFGEAEVVALVDRAAKGGPYRLSSREGDVEVSFEISQAVGEDKTSAAPRAGVVRSALACGHRTFLRSAGACLDTTTVPVQGTMTVKTVAGRTLLDRVPATGALEVHGTRLSSASLSLKHGASPGDHVYLRSRDGVFALQTVEVGTRRFSL